MKSPFISRKEHERRLVQEQNAHIEHLHALKAQVTNLESGSPLFWLFAEKNPVITDTMMEQIANIAEVDPQLVDLVRRLMVAQQGYRATLPTEQDRLLAVNEVRLLSWNDPVTERMLTLWTDYGFGLGWFIKPQDDAAEMDWNEYYEAARNQPILGESGQQELSDTVLRDGEFWFVYFVDKLTGLTRVRVVLTDEIKEIITDPDDLHIPIYYRREFTRGKNKTGETLYYLDWHLNPTDPDDAKVIAGADIPKDAKLAHEDKLGTYVVAQHVAHRRKGINQLRGWPMPATGAAWARAYKQFLENRAAVARAVAAVVDKLVAKGGSQAMEVIQNKFNAALSTTGKYGLTNPPLAGSTWLQNEALDRQRMPLNTGAGDARIDGGSLLSMAGLPAGLPPHLLGRGEVVRMAVAEAMDDPVYRQFTRYQSFWSGIWKDMISVVLTMREVFGGAKYKNHQATIQTDNLRNVEIADIATLSNMILALHAADLIQGEEADDLYSNLTIQLMRMGLLTLGIKDPDALLGLEDFEAETITVETLKKKLAVLQNSAPAEARVLLHAMQSYLGGAIDYGSTVEFLKDALEEQEG